MHFPPLLLRCTSGRWANQVKVSETTPDSLIMKEAEERVEVAQIAYRETRNRLAEKRVVGSTGTNTCLPISTTE